MSSDWPNLSDLIVDKSVEAPIGLVGAPLDAGSVTPGRCDLAPGLLRATLRRIGRYDVETGKELASRIADHGDVPIAGLSIEEATWARDLTPPTADPLAFIWAFERVQTAEDVDTVLKLIADYDLPREALPTQWLNEARVWEALLAKMPMTAMIRNLATMTRVGLLAPLSEAVIRCASAAMLARLRLRSGGIRR